MASKDGNGQCLPPPLPAAAKNYLPVARPSVGSCGRRIQLLTNHFMVRLNGADKVFYQYSVSITRDDGDKRVVQSKDIGRKVMDKLYQIYKTELAGKEFAYDGERALFTVGPLPQTKMKFTVVLEDSSPRSAGDGIPEGPYKKRSCNVYRARIFNVEISFSKKIPTKAIMNGDIDGVQDVLRVLDIILRQQASKRGCLLVKQSFFGDYGDNLVSLGGGISGCYGFHSGFRTTQNGLSLNMDVSTTMIMTPGPVIDFLLANQNVTDPQEIDWTWAKRMLKNMRIKTKHHKMEFKISGLSELPCNRQLFSMNKDGEKTEMTVFDYFLCRKNINLSWSHMFPCLDVGRPKHPNYVPIELCDLISLQRYTKALSVQQRASLVEKSQQKPQERIKVVTDALRTNRYDDDSLLAGCGIAIERQLTRVEGRVLEAPAIKFGGSSEDFVPRNGCWSINDKTLWSPVGIDRWVIVNFSARCDVSYISRELINCGRKKGMRIEQPYNIVEEDPQFKNAGPIARVDRMFELLMLKLPGCPDFILCVLPERKNSDLYGPWKKKNLLEMGIKTQCISPTKINDQYLTNVLLKINAKLGGTNSILAIEMSLGIPLVSEIPTLILGMDVSHGSPGHSGAPSIAAVVGSRCWPLISQYRASVRCQPPRVEMIESLYKSPKGKDGIMRDILVDFYKTSNHRKPEQIIIFRDGVSESQFSQVLNIELDQIIKVIELLGVDRLPKFTVIIAQKNHHTKLFLADSPDNVPAGTVVDSGVVHPRNYDFYLCAHAGMIGTSRPTHYHVLLDEIGFPADDLQKLIHSLSYVYQRSTTAVSIVAPIAYAHLAAQQISKFVKFEDVSRTSSGQETAFSEILPKLHPEVAASMFFC